jgi:hypothetical protein
MKKNGGLKQVTRQLALDVHTVRLLDAVQLANVGGGGTSGVSQCGALAMCTCATR